MKEGLSELSDLGTMLTSYGWSIDNDMHKRCITYHGLPFCMFDHFSISITSVCYE